MTIHYHARNRCFSITEAVVRFQATVSLVPSNIEDPLPRPPVTTPRGLPPPLPRSSPLCSTHTTLSARILALESRARSPAHSKLSRHLM